MVIVVLALGLIFIPAPEEKIELPVEPVAEEPVVEVWSEKKMIGTSVEGREIFTHRFGTGSTSLLFVGGIHGGYEWNTVELANLMVEYFATNPSEVPDGLAIHIIPSLNPDGLAVVTEATDAVTLANVTNWNSDGRGRFNANGVDLNRNFACKWQDKGTWRGVTTKTGTGAFSEPEARALRDYVESIQPKVGVFWHSIAGAVYGSECEDGILPATLDIMNAYAKAGDYGAVPVFDAYPVTGDAEGWLASIGIPAVSVELETRNDPEWDRNLAGVKAVLEYYSK